MESSIVIGILIFLIVFILWVDYSGTYDLGIFPSVDCAAKTEEMKQYLISKNPGANIVEIMKVFNNNRNTCSVLAVQKANNTYSFSSAAFPFDYSYGNYSLPSDYSVIEGSGVYGEDVKKILVSAYATSTDSIMEVYLVDQTTKQYVTVVNPYKFTATGKGNSVYFVFDIPDNNAIVFHTNDCPGCDVYVDVLDYLVVSSDGSNRRIKSIKDSLYPLKDSVPSGVDKYTGWSNDNTRWGYVKEGQFKWDLFYRAVTG